MHSNFPLELRQWVVWKFGPPRPNGKRPKVPCTPATGKEADSTNPETWGTYEEACKAAKGFDGVGFMFLAGQGYTGIDLDDCRDIGTRTIKKWAREIIDRFNSYTELSPSFTGVHIIIKGELPGGEHRKGSIEMYDCKRFFTVTGRTMSYGSRPITECQDELNRLYAETFGERKRPTTSTNQRHTALSKPEVTIDDASLIEVMSNAANSGEVFRHLWAGEWETLKLGDGTQSAADVRLCGLLAYYTGGDEERMDRLFRQSGMYRPKWDERRGDSTYGAQTILRAINGATSFYVPDGERKRSYRPVFYTHPYQRVEEEQPEREQVLQARAEEVKEWTARAIDQGEPVTGIASPPGVGKSFTVAEWGINKDIAYLVPRHAQEQSIPILEEQYHIIQAPNATTCENWELHNALARAGYNTSFAHQHNCLYRQQFGQEGSAVYQIAHATTSYPAKHSAIVVDEFNLTDWYSKREFTLAQVKQARSMFEKSTPAYQLLRAFQIVLSDVEADEVLQGKELFDTINSHLGGRLEQIIEALSSDYKATDRYPIWVEREDTDRVVLPHLWNMVNDELVPWKHGGDWNSYMRVTGQVKRKGNGPDQEEKVELLSLTEPCRFQARSEGSVPPLVILDATMHEEFLQRWAGQPVKLYRPEIDPPPHTRHIGVRIGRCSKRSLAGNQEYRQQVINQAGYTLDKFGIDREKTGLITYKEFRDEIGDSLGIPAEQRLHFFGARGSNALEHCETLLVIGTPALPPGAMYRYARAIYHDDPVPIIEASDKTETGEHRYRDRRVQELAEYLTKAELTQCAHRNRPLRYDGRTVITFCKSEIDFLPVTDEIVTFPTLTEKKAEQERVALEAIEQLIAEGKPLTVRSLLKVCPMDRNRAVELLREFR